MGLLLCAIFPSPDHAECSFAHVWEGTKPHWFTTGRYPYSRGDATVLVVGADNKVETRQIVLSRAIGDKSVTAG